MYDRGLAIKGYRCQTLREASNVFLLAMLGFMISGFCLEVIMKGPSALRVIAQARK